MFTRCSIRNWYRRRWSSVPTFEGRLTVVIDQRIPAVDDTIQIVASRIIDEKCDAQLNINLTLNEAAKLVRSLTDAIGQLDVAAEHRALANP